MSTVQAFLKDVENHVLTVRKKDGLHRHLTLYKPNISDQHYNITTWPGYLCISGDMGCYVFARRPDMFQFFRSGDGGVGINPRYWSEKAQSSDKYGSIKKFSQAKFEEVGVTEYTERYIWCCRAIVWAIQQYDQLKKEQEAA